MDIKKIFRKNKKVMQEFKDTMAKAPEKKNVTRRYCFMVEEVYETTRLQGVMVQGTIHGKINEGDTMYLYQLGKETKEVHVLSIENGPREMLQTARNSKVALGLDLENAEDISKYAVLSSIAPQSEEEALRDVENPRLFGLMMEYSNNYTSNLYMDALVRELCNAKFVLPLYMDRPPMFKEDGSMEFGKDAQVGFRALKKWDDDTKTVFPAFTDKVALLFWKDAFHEKQPRRLIGLVLPTVMEYVEQGHAGLIMNAFGPTPVFFPVELLRQVQKSDYYKELFPEKEVPEAVELEDTVASEETMEEMAEMEAVDDAAETETVEATAEADAMEDAEPTEN